MAIAFPTTAQRLSSVADTMLKSATKPALDWKPVDIDSMPAPLRALYDNYKHAQAIAAEQRQIFEDNACGPLAKLLAAKPGQDVAFGYKFGKLSVALTDKAAPRAAANALRF